MRTIAVLASGGVDSSILMVDLAGTNRVAPLYVAMGLAWEAEERQALDAFVAAVDSPRIDPVTTLSLPVGALYGKHWSVTGRRVPGGRTPDAAVFLPGRNVLLLGLASVWCKIHEVHSLAIGTLAANPFPDATPEFFAGFAEVTARGLAHSLSITAPYRALRKADLIRRHAGLPLDLTLTCLTPRDGAHCGRCNKCAERRRAFAQAGVPDATRYRHA